MICIMCWDSTATQYDMHHVLGQYSNTVCVMHITRWDSTGVLQQQQTNVGWGGSSDWGPGLTGQQQIQVSPRTGQ